MPRRSSPSCASLDAAAAAAADRPGASLPASSPWSWRCRWPAPTARRTSATGTVDDGGLLQRDRRPTTCARTRAAPLWGNRALPGRMPERALFPGVMILLLAAVGAGSAARRDARRRTPVALLVAFEMSRGFNSPFYPYLYDVAARSFAGCACRRAPASSSGLTLALLARLWRAATSGRTLGVAAAGSAGGARGRDRASTCGRCCGSNRSGPSRRRSTAPSRATRASSSPSSRSAATPRASRRTRPSCTSRSGTGRRCSTATAATRRRDRPTSSRRCRDFRTRPPIALLRARGATHVTINCALYRGGCDELVAAVDASPAFRRRRVGQVAGCARAARTNCSVSDLIRRSASAARPTSPNRRFSQAFHARIASDRQKPVFYNPDRPMRDLRTHLVSARVDVARWRPRSCWSAGCSRRCPFVRGRRVRPSGPLARVPSQAAAQTPETFIQQARRALARGRTAEAERWPKRRPAGDRRRRGRAAHLASSARAATTKRCGCSSRRHG